ncbi:hypothetical protein P3W24_03490 [Luteibacter sp. PPL201]|uniref:Lipoprotein n=1 Tax=Luteibacter sahnii TaxID=3021977 RepID=A0ABT6B7H5_9GAMM|nr:hypothetical protein [Luteibacter sp. PPL193]MDY1548012.1 hypothetical protein [Luteibacter sp. PPL193]
MPKVILSALFCVTTMSACAVQAGHAGDSVASAQDALRKMAPASTVTCVDNGHGSPDCKADGHTAQFLGCGDGAMYGGISADGGVDIGNAIDGHGKTIAHLADGQFVCVAAIVQRPDESRFYVVAIPTASVKGCKGNELCKGADHPVQWKTATTGTSCHRAGDDYAGDCAAGWVGQGDLDQYANGL